MKFSNTETNFCVGNKLGVLRKLINGVAHSEPIQASEKEFSAKSVKGLKLLTVFTRELRLTIFDKVPSPPLILRNKEFRAFSWNFEIWGFISLHEILRKLMCGIAHVCFAHPESSTASEAKFFSAKIVNSSNPDTIFARKSHLRLLTGL